jgi:hypothetical protein
MPRVFTIHYGSTEKDCQLTPPYRLLPTPTVSEPHKSRDRHGQRRWIPEAVDERFCSDEPVALESAVHTDPPLGWDLVNLVQSVSIRRSAKRSGVGRLGSPPLGSGAQAQSPFETVTALDRPQGRGEGWCGDHRWKGEKWVGLALDLLFTLLFASTVSLAGLLSLQSSHRAPDNTRHEGLTGEWLPLALGRTYDAVCGMKISATCRVA